MTMVFSFNCVLTILFPTNCSVIFDVHILIRCIMVVHSDKHFNGKDVISVTIFDTKGHEDSQSAYVKLKPYNDPPFIDVSDVVKIATNKGAVVPPIVVGDPDDMDGI